MSPTSTQPPFASAPGDLLIEIANFLESQNDTLNFALTCNYVYENVSAVLYRSVTLGSLEEINTTLAMLGRRFDIARHVRELYIRPQAKHKTQLKPAENAEAALAVRELASLKCLDALHRFRWDADELPLHDDMWFALRMGCPQLRFIGSSIGFNLPDLNSNLFDFRDLRGFSLFLKPGFYESHMDMFLDEEQPIFKKFWDMLIKRCPDLEELAIDGLSSVPADIHFLVEGRWPNLRKLSLGDVCIDWFPRSLNPGEKRPFISFLEAHPHLEYLSLSRHSIQPIHFTSLELSTLSRVSSFSGTHQQLQALPHLHRSVTSVDFCDPVETREVSAPTVANLLRELPHLTTLKISFVLHSMYDSGNLLRSLIQSCPLLRQLELTCAHKPSFQLDAFAKTIRGFPKLRILRLTIVKYPGDETLAEGAIRIAKSNPRLQKFSLTFIPPVYPVPLPFAIPYRPFAFPFHTNTSGSFEVSCDEHGLPISLLGMETTTFVWPWGLGSLCTHRKYVHDLRPMGYYDHLESSDEQEELGALEAKRAAAAAAAAAIGSGSTVAGALSGAYGSVLDTTSDSDGGIERRRRLRRRRQSTGQTLRTFMRLVCEKSSAGEEMRMILFCGFLAFLAGCGISANGATRSAAAAAAAAERLSHLHPVASSVMTVATPSIADVVHPLVVV